MATVTIRPTSDTYRDSHTVGNGSVTTDLWSFIDEATLDTGDYLLCSLDKGSIRAEFGWSSSGLTNETINKITLCAYAFDCKLFYSYNDGANSVDTGKSLDGVDGLLSYEMATNPSTSSAWTVSDIENLESGVLLNVYDSKAMPKLYQLYIVIDYSTSGSAGVPKQFMHYARLRSNQ